MQNILVNSSHEIIKYVKMDLSSIKLTLEEEEEKMMCQVS